MKCEVRQISFQRDRRCRQYFLAHNTTREPGVSGSKQNDHSSVRSAHNGARGLRCVKEYQAKIREITFLLHGWECAEGLDGQASRLVSTVESTKLPF
jgi:hypothetical protein